MTWTCPCCDRAFGRRGQSHQCEPTEPLAEYLDRWSSNDRAVAEAVIERVESCGPVDVEAAGVGLLFRTSRTIVELRPKRDRLELSVVLDRDVDHPRVRSRARASARAVAVRLDLHDVDDVDELVEGLIAEAYAAHPAAQPPGGV